MSNPYRSPESQKDSSSTPTFDRLLKHRCCPTCETPVHWTRLWLRPWLNATWDCHECGEYLSFNRRRRYLAVAVFAAVIAGTRFAFYDLNDSGSYLPYLYLFSIIPASAAFLIDGVERKGF